MSDKEQILQIANQVFTDEIDGLNSVAKSLGYDFIHAVEMLLECKGKVVVTGIGKSGHIGSKIAATLASTGTPAFFVHSAEALHGDLGMIDHNDIVIAISYSGESEELLSIISAIRHKDIPLIVITGNDSSSLAKIANCVLKVSVGKEACPLNLAPTTSTTATLVIGDALAVVLLTLKQFKADDFAKVHPGGSLGRRLLTKVADIMHTGERLPIVSVDSNFKEVIVEISKKALGFTAVINDKEQLVGMITDGDLRRALDRQQDFSQVKAKDIMNTHPKRLNPKDLAIVAVDLVDSYKITGFLAVSPDNKVVGALNLHDLFKAKLL